MKNLAKQNVRVGAASVGRPMLANAKVVATCADRLVPPRVEGREKRVAAKVMARFEKCGELFATADPCDRAHLVRTGRHGFLTPAAGLGGLAKARKYPRSYMHERIETYRVKIGNDERLVERAVEVVSDETVFDETFAAQCWLARELGNLGGRRIGGGEADLDDLRLRDVCEPRSKWRDPLTRETLTEDQLREMVLHRRIRARLTAEERMLEAAADRLLEAAGLNRDGSPQEETGDARPHWETSAPTGRSTCGIYEGGEC